MIMTGTGKKFRNDGLSTEELGNGLITLGRLLGVLGVLFLPFASYTTMQYRDVQKWQSAAASVVRVEHRSPVHVSYSKNSSRGRKTIIYFVGVRYRYTFDGHSYTGYGEFGRSDSPEDPVYKKELARLVGLQAASGTFPVVVNPRRPMESLKSKDDKTTYASVFALWFATALMLCGWPLCGLMGNLALSKR